MKKSQRLKKMKRRRGKRIKCETVETVQENPPLMPVIPKPPIRRLTSARMPLEELTRRLKQRGKPNGG